MNLQIPKKAAVINSFAGYGRCSLTEALPILSAMRVQACPVPFFPIIQGLQPSPVRI